MSYKNYLILLQVFRPLIWILGILKKYAFHLTNGVIIEGNIGNLMKAVMTSVRLVDSVRDVYRRT
jgi:hypothetical protein